MSLPGCSIDALVIGDRGNRHAREVALIKCAWITVASGCTDGDDFVLHMEVCSDRACMALQGPVVLLPARDAGGKCMARSGQQHIGIARRIRCEGGTAVFNCRLAGMTWTMLTYRRTTPCFDAAGDHDIGIACCQHAVGQRNSIKAG